LRIVRILVTGANGRLGSYLLERLVGREHEIIAWSGKSHDQRSGLRVRPVDLTDARALLAAINEADPDVVIHAAAVSSAEVAHRQPDRARAVNVEGTSRLAEWAARNERRLVYTSTDLVFDGTKSWYEEDDPAEPILEYGRSKQAGERPVLALERGVVARMGLLYGPSRSGGTGFFDRALAALQAGTPQTFFTDEYRTPLHYETAARILVRLAESDATGLMHVGGPERLSRFELMRRVATAMGIDSRFVVGNLRSNVPSAESRPADVSLATRRLESMLPDMKLPRIEESLTAQSGERGSA
jgi:dTDP-4-dehydrorhamnose reductase